MYIPFKKVIIVIMAITIAIALVIITANQVKDNKIKGWQESPIFKVGNYTMIGEKGRLGFVYDNDVTKFYPNKVNKYMWHFWGKDSEFEGELKVIAVYEKTGEEVILLSGALGSANNGANHHLPSNMSLPKSGMWKLDAYIGDKLFGTIFVRVYE